MQWHLITTICVYTHVPIVALAIAASSVFASFAFSSRAINKHNNNDNSNTHTEQLSKQKYHSKLLLVTKKDKL